MTTGSLPAADSPRETAARIVRRLRSAGHEAYLVGGCVRDLLMGRDPEDFDIVTSARPEEVRGLFEKTVPVGEKFGVVIVIEGAHRFEVATYRTEGPYEDGRRPSRVAFATAKEDALRRDFTVNGLLLDPVSEQVIDYVGGRQDVDRKLVRTIGEPDVRFGEDHLRMLRAVRFAANLDFEIELATLESIERNAAKIRRISAERVRDELNKLLTGGRAASGPSDVAASSGQRRRPDQARHRGRARRGFELLAGTRLLHEILPEVEAMRGCGQPPGFHPEGDVWEHTLGMLAGLPEGGAPRLAWGVLMHDIGKPATRTEDAGGVHFHGHTQAGVEIAGRAMRRLRLSNAEIEAVQALVHHHMRFMHVKEMRQNKLKRFLRMPDFDLHLELHRLDCVASHGKLGNYDFCRAKIEELPEEDLRPARLLSGHDLIEMGFEPGPLFGEVLRAVEDAQLDGELATAAEAREFVLERWKPRR